MPRPPPPRPTRSGSATTRIAEGIATFAPEHHRGESVATVDEVRFVDNSKATNPHATIAAVGEADGVVLIAGGDAKGIDLSPLASLAPRLVGVIAIGSSAAEVRAVFEGRVPVRDAGSIEEATRLAFAMASAGGTVLLAPACASWDMFRDYAERRRPLRRRRPGAREAGRPNVSSIGAASPRPRALRLVRPDERPTTRARTDLRTRRTLALLLGSTAFLVGSGLVMVLSASSVTAFAEYGDSFLFVQRQAAYAVVGVLALLLTSRMRYDAWKRLAGPFLLVTMAMLILVLVPAHGIEAYGSSRWFRIGPVTVQPSELAKLSLIVFAAATLARNWTKRDDLRQLAVPLLPISVLVCGLVMMQPDLGTTVILAATMFALAFAAGVRLRYLTFASVVGALIGAGLIMSADYRRVRFLAFLHPGPM
jgi:hypothetical protein